MHGSKRVIRLTADGSPTVALPELGITYHSTHGAMQESLHVFLRCGLDEALGAFDGRMQILEMGFGTGLNAWLTALAAVQHQRTIHYHTLELFPLQAEEIRLLNFTENPAEQLLFSQLHAAPWNTSIALNSCFTLEKSRQDLLTAPLPGAHYQLTFYDAFAPEDQPELWTEAVFRKLHTALAGGGILVTYCSKSIVRKAMQAAGFRVEKIPGPPGKREIIRARKPY